MIIRSLTLIAIGSLVACSSDESPTPTPSTTGSSGTAGSTASSSGSSTSSSSGATSSTSTTSSSGGSSGSATPAATDCEAIADQYCATCGPCTPDNRTAAVNHCKNTPCKDGFIQCWAQTCDAQKCACQ